MEKLITALKIYGLRGLKVYLRLLFGELKRIYREDVKSPIYLRRKTSDIHTYHQMFIDKEYAIDFPFEPQIIIDAGANMGLAALYFANRFPESTIISIEPEKNNFELLRLNVKLYQTVFPIQRAISNSSGQLINIVDNNIGNWGFSTAIKTDSQGKKLKGSVKTISVKTILETYNLNYIDILKVDIEGGEQELFEDNYEDWIPNTKCIIIELHERMRKDSSKNFIAAMDKYNFTSFRNGENLVYINENLK